MQKKKIFLVLTLVTTMMLISASATFVMASSPEKIRVNIGFKEAPNAELIQAYGGEIIREISLINTITAIIPETSFDPLKNDPVIEFVEEDAYLNWINGETLPWGIDRIDAEIVWGGSEDSTTIASGAITGSGIQVAVLDTGIDYTHPDLDDNYAGGYDFANGDDDPLDDHGHGTHCCGVVGAEENTEGVIGAAPLVDILAVKVLDSQGSGSVSDICAGIDWAVNNGAEVISLSLGSSSSSDTLKNSCDNAYAAGVLIVAAAGNSGDNDTSTNEYGYPAAYDSVIAVGATDKDDNVASFSNTGPYLELAAPGVDIYSTMPTYDVTLNSGPPWSRYSQNYDTMSGTSMACPHVSGVAALVFEKGVDDANSDGYINDDVRNVLDNNSEDLGPAGRDNGYGYGLVDAEAAVNAAGGGSDTNTAPDAPTNPSPSDGATGVSTSPTLSVDVSDPDGDSMDVSFYDASDGSLIGTDTGVASGGTASVTWSSLAYNTTYSWYTVADDGAATATSSTWQFTTEEETTNSAPDAPTNPSPSDGATGVSTSPTLSVDVSDPDGDSMDVSFYDASDGSLIGTDTGVASGGTASVTWDGLAYNTTYEWYTVADDGSASTTSSTWSFTTEEETTTGSMHVQDVNLWLDRTRGPWEDIGVEVTIVDSDGNAVSDATVDIELETPEGNFLTDTATTDSSGVASTVFAKASTTSGTYTGTVLDVTHSSYTYDSSANVETSDTLTTS